jgi:hypothetical protein
MADPIVPVDPATQAAQLAQHFFDLANSTRDFRARNYASLSADRRQQLQDQADALQMRGLHFTADAYAAIAQQLHPYLDRFTKATQKAKDALAHLNDVAKALTIVDSAVALVRSVAEGDIGAAGSDIQNLAAAAGAGG